MRVTPRLGWWMLFIAILSTAAAVRLWDLEARAVGHIEMYAPNIPLPEQISDPPPRMTLTKTVTGSFWEPHPPAWYVLNWPWTLLVGATPFALRFPSVVFGVCAVGLVWAFASRERSQTTGAVASLLLAFNGLHIMWSQVSRPVVLMSMLGLATSTLLLMLRTPGSRRIVLPSYLLLSLLGLATDYYYWPFMAGQIAWTLLDSASGRSRLSGLVQWQWLILVVASPLITLAVAQSRESYLESGILITLSRYLAFGFLVSPDRSEAPMSLWLWVPVLMLGCVLAAATVIRDWRRPTDANGEGVGPSAPAIMGGAVLGAMAVIVAAAHVFASHGMASRGQLLSTLAAPILFAGLSSASIRMGRLLSIAGAGRVALSTVLATVPVALVALLSVVKPIIDWKYFLMFSPFLLVIIADALVQMVRQTPRRAVARVLAGTVVAVLVAAHVSSVRMYASLTVTPIDHRGLALRLRSRLVESDRLLVFRHYAMTPLFYHLSLPDARYVGSDYARVRREGARQVWLVSLRDAEVPDPPGYREAIAGCSLRESISASRIRAERYADCSPLR